MIVVDTNVIGYLYLASERSEQAESVLQRDSEWVAPWLWRSELANVLATYVRRDQLALPDAHAILDRALDRMNGGEFDVAPPRALSLAAASSCSAYDCEFVALAQDLDVPLITVDRQLQRRFPGVALAPDAFAARD